MIKSMTGFASRTGATPGWSWAWELRAVNARGHDLRLRLPDWVEGLESAVRAAFKPVVARGNVTLNLRVQRDAAGGATQVDPVALHQVLAAIKQIEDTALGDHDLELAQTSAGEILSLRAISEPVAVAQDVGPLLAALKRDLAGLIEDFDAMRRAEGAALAEVLTRQIDQIEDLTRQAGEQARARQVKTAKSLREALARVLENADGADADRVAQELALIAVKADVTEEIDRLNAHVGAARDLLAAGGAVGRKLDFLTQEFNREANTLCSKAQYSELTKIGLDLKAVIDQMREQVQNVE